MYLIRVPGIPPKVRAIGLPDHLAVGVVAAGSALRRRSVHAEVVVRELVEVVVRSAPRAPSPSR